MMVYFIIMFIICLLYFPFFDYIIPKIKSQWIGIGFIIFFNPLIFYLYAFITLLIILK